MILSLKFACDTDLELKKKWLFDQSIFCYGPCQKCKLCYDKNYAGTIYQSLLPKRIYPAYIFSSIVRRGKKEKWGHKDYKSSNISSLHQMNSPNFVSKVTLRPFTSRSKLPLSLIWGLEKKKISMYNQIVTSEIIP